MGRFLRNNEQLLLGVLMFAIWAVGYFAVAHATAGGPSYRIPTAAWEQRIPFMPVFVFVYLTIYPLFVLPFLFIRNREFFRLFSSAYITVMLICYITYLVFPVSIERPEITEASFSAWALSIVFRADKPWNCFPSMHVAMSFLASLTIWEVHRVRGTLALLLTTLIAASTVLTKQHYVVDVIAGLCLTLAVYFAYFRRRILAALYENILRAEETVEKWVNRRIDQRIAERLADPGNERLRALLRAVLEEVLEERPDPRPATPSRGSGREPPREKE